MSTEISIRVVIADDHDIYLEGFQSMLSKQPGIEVVGVARNGKELTELARELEPDVVLTDIMMPVMDGIAATKYISRHLPRIRILAMTVFLQESLVVDMLEAGASGFISKSADKSEMLEAVRSVYLNAPYYCRGTTTLLARLIGRSRYNPKHGGQPLEFSDREKEVIQLICREKTTKEMAEYLSVSERTIDGYRSRIHEKTQAQTVAGIVIYALKNNLYQIL